MEGAIADARRDLEATLNAEHTVPTPPSFKKLPARSNGTAADANGSAAPAPHSTAANGQPLNGWQPASPEVAKWSQPVPDELRASHYQRR